MALTPEQKTQLAALEKPLGQALYSVAPYDALARELQRVGASLQRNLEAAMRGNRQMVAGIADYRNGAVPVALEDRAADEFTIAMRRTVGALSRALDEFANTKAICVQLEAPKVGQLVTGLTSFHATLAGVLADITPPEPVPEPEPDPDLEVKISGGEDKPDVISVDSKDSRDR